jgi:4-amino-4-deoxy-L-arabinose transferase-like glycosyltransferase
LIEQRATITTPVEVPGAPVAGALERSAASWRSRLIAALRTSTAEQRFLALLLTVFLIKGVAITFIHDPYTGHDEVAHYAYLEMVATEHRIPVLPELSAWREERKRRGKDSHDRMAGEFWRYCRMTTVDWSPGCGDPRYRNTPVYAMVLGANYFPTGWIYTANHPPLYYILMTPLFWLTDGQSIENQLYVFRLAAIPFGLLTVLLAYLTARTLFPGDRFLTLGVPTFVAFQPQIAYESAMLNNDILAIAFTSAVVYLLVRGLKTGFPLKTVILIGFCYGLAVLSKNTALTTGAIIAIALVLGIGVRRWRQWLPRGLLVALITGAMIWPWYLYMYRTYGDFTALERIRELQYWNYNSGVLPTVWDQLTSKTFFWMRWRETWGEFGWRQIPLGKPGDWPLLRVLMWVSLFATVGLGVWAVRLWRTGHRLARADSETARAELAAGADPIFLPERWQVVGVLTMGATCVLAYAAVLQFGTTFSLTQARYYFPAIIPAALLFILGLRAIIPRRWLGSGHLAVFVAMAALNIVIYVGFVLPHLAATSSN